MPSLWTVIGFPACTVEKKVASSGRQQKAQSFLTSASFEEPKSLLQICAGIRVAGGAKE